MGTTYNHLLAPPTVKLPVKETFPLILPPDNILVLVLVSVADISPLVMVTFVPALNLALTCAVVSCVFVFVVYEGNPNVPSCFKKCPAVPVVGTTPSLPVPTLVLISAAVFCVFVSVATISPSVIVIFVPAVNLALTCAVDNCVLL